MEDLIDKGLILFGKDHLTQPTRKYFLKENMYENVPSIYSYGASDDNFFYEIGLEFQYMKPTDVAKYLIKSMHPNPRVILDFFAGSGTTGHATLEINKEDDGDRQFILCTNNENKICTEVCYPRIQKVIEGYIDSKKSKVVGLGGNLKYFKTDFVDAEPTDKNKKKLIQTS
jgi:adenine-specific DNA-methyltransferase